ncbi:hypothetical protein LSH36_47g04000 [Paralvinella palmiformis]|uniref:Transmembrane protein 19 n=1 Tax=Paralvinella palmiformis TaxID=53620 RepID=A0AAD9K668_9ANNE|nr:hypothetical protein LSH36_47g04000 [Paralvinella palmiformis]
MLFFVIILATTILLSFLFWIFNIISYILTTDQEPLNLVSPLRWMLSIIVPLFMTQWGLKQKALDNTGAFAAFLVGFVLMLSNYCFMSSVLIFFVVGSKATKFRSWKKINLEKDFKEGGERNWIQVLCNGGVATEVAILYMIDCGCGEHVTDFTKHYTQSWLGMALLGAVSCSCADTLASEIGTVVGGWDPRLVTTFRRVPKGTNGGVTIVGIIASIFGGLIIGISYYCMLLMTVSADILEASPPQWPIVTIGMASGLLGSLVDSYLGATVQFSGDSDDDLC